VKAGFFKAKVELYNMACAGARAYMRYGASPVLGSRGNVFGQLHPSEADDIFTLETCFCTKCMIDWLIN